MTRNKKANQTEIAGAETTPRKKRTPTVLPPEIQEQVDKAKAAAKTAIGGAKRLAKCVALINEMDEWSLDQIPAAIERRRTALSQQ